MDCIQDWCAINGETCAQLHLAPVPLEEAYQLDVRTRVANMRYVITPVFPLSLILIRVFYQ